jgi:hypothetical protein
MLKFLRLIRAKDEDVEYYRSWLDNIRSFHEFVFVTLESLVIMGAFLAAWRSSHSILILCLYWIAFAAAFSFIQGYLRLAMHAAADRFELPSRFRPSFLWVSGTLSTVIAALLPYFFGAAVEEIISNHIMI